MRATEVEGYADTCASFESEQGVQTHVFVKPDDPGGEVRVTADGFYTVEEAAMLIEGLAEAIAKTVSYREYAKASADPDPQRFDASWLAAVIGSGAEKASSAT